MSNLPRTPRFIADRIVNTVVALSYKPESNDAWETHATGFLFGKLLRAEGKTSRSAVFLVTNKHVLVSAGRSRIMLYVSANLTAPETPSGWGEIVLVDGNNEPVWVADEIADIAVLQIDIGKFKKAGSNLDWLTDETDCLRLEEMRQHQIIEGESVYIVGFPGLLPETKRVCPVFREGVIARIEDTYLSRQEFFMVDANTFAGNSGGPVFLKPSPFHLSGTPGYDKGVCIGVISGGWSITGRLTKLTKSVSLAKIWPINAIDKIIEAYLQKRPLKQG